LTNLNISNLGGTIWNTEVGGSKKINIGEAVGIANDSAPTAKTASSFGAIRGLPEEPTKQGTYNAAAVAYYANTNPITTLGNQRVQTFSIALSSTLPRIQMPVGSGTITLLPFGKVVSTGATEQFTGFYIDSLYNMKGQPQSSSVNGGRAQAIFRVVFDDCEQGCDYDMDSIVLYTVEVNAAGTLDVTAQTVYAKAGNESHMGYTIAGTTQDGIYLEVSGGGSSNVNYALDTPGTKLPGACPCTGTGSLLSSSIAHKRNFTASSGSTATSITNLQNPLWYAAKWGGFGDAANTTSSLPVAGQWDSNTAGTPNNYFLVTNASTLKAQLSKAFNQILQKNSAVAAPAVSQSLSASNSSSSYVNSLNVAYWSGDLTKSTTSSTTTGTTTTTSTVQNWVASQQMPAWGSRQIMMANTAGTGLQSFTYSNLSNLTYAGVQLQTTLTSAQVDFVRGDTSKETSTFRKRASLIGDVVNSGPVVVSTADFLPSVADTLDGTDGTYATFKTTQASRRAQVYVGANDGMLHAFDATTGVEKFAFIPTAVISNLSTLSTSTYNSDSSLHKYYVDGTSVTSDVYFGGAWHTVLVGTLGGGGREVFALDVTNPDNITLLWEFTSQTDADLGYTFAAPVIAKLHSGEWGVIVGNGYNGNNGNASLLILNIATGATIKKLATSVSGNNGLSSPVVLDANSDGIADYVYAGDLQGNVWRFDLIGASSLTDTASASSFKVAFANKPLYAATASDTAGSAVQSITAPPTLVRHPSANGILVVFGTGRYFTTADKSTTDLQTLYGIWDKQTAAQAAASTPILARSSLQAQTITLQVNNATFGSSTSAIRTVSKNSVDWGSKSGWYLDLVVGSSLLGERLVDPIIPFGSVLFASTRTPSTDVCTPGITGWTYGLDPTTGGRTSFSVFNLSRNGTVSDSDKYNDTVVSGFSTAAGGFVVTSKSNGSGSVNIENNIDTLGAYTGPNFNGRQTWRVIPSP
jgi:type IV pilus assembly protein PilY1